MAVANAGITIIVAGLLALAATSLPVVAQPSLQLGVGGGGRWGLIAGSVPVYAGSTDCGEFRLGTSSASSFALHSTMPSLFSDDWGLSFQLGIERSSGHFQTVPNDRTIVVDQETGLPVTLDRLYRLDYSSTSIQFDLQARWKVGSRISLSFGPWGGVQTAYHSSVTDNIIGPGDIGLAGGERSVALPGGTQLSGRTLAYGVTVGGSVQVPAGIFLWVPELTIRSEFSPAAREASWMRFCVGTGMSLMFDFMPHRVPPALPPVADPLPVSPHVPRLQASIRLNGIDENGKPVRVTTVKANEVLYRRYIPLLPALFFDFNSAAIAERYERSDSIDPVKFSPQMLRGDGDIDVHRYNLAVIGARLREHPAAKLYLWGSVSNDEPSRLASERVAAVGRYLRDRWGVDPARIVVSESGHTVAPSGQSTEDGREENRRVEFWSNDPALTAPITSDRIVRDFNPPAIALDPRIDAEAGVKHWRISIRQSGVVVASYSSDDTAQTSSPDLAWNIADDRIDSVPAPISVDFEVEDSTGATTTAHDELPLAYERRVRVIDKFGEGDIDRISHSLVAFDYNSAEPRRQHIARLAEIALTVTPNASITVTGYTDRIGGEGFNADLSKRRADRVVTLLRDELAKRGLHDVTVSAEGAGIESRRFSNDSPEGRILSRGVQIVVELSHNHP